ncbi:hypothetical protein Q7P35_003642 [Cladosporium inversicolor]
MKGLSTTTASRATPKALILMVIGMTLLLAAHLCYTYPSLASWKIPTTMGTEAPPNVTSTPPPEEELPCRKLEGGEDVLVVMRTGATEIKDKLPAHLNTTLQCYNNYVIFSDYEEDFEGHHVYDLLAGVEDDVKENHPDFALWRRLRAYGRESLDDAELSGTISEDSGATGKTGNDGWKLDKWKFLPMAVRTLELYPDMKYYVFIEPDTYIMWSNLLDWLRQLDPTDPAYYGSEVQIGPDVFAHGGSSFVISNPALQKVAKLYREDASDWHVLTSAHWAGDCILGKALAESGTPLTWSWPMFQGGNPHTMDFKESKPDGRDLWCAPALSYHHLSPSEIESMFAFEQEWIRSTQEHKEKSSVRGYISWRQTERMRIHHQDVFRSYVLPSTTEGDRADWSNLSPELRAGTQNSTLSECRTMCETSRGCVQYALSDMGCSFSQEGLMGQSAEGVQSGWIEDRMRASADAHGVCERRVMGWTVT